VGSTRSKGRRALAGATSLLGLMWSLGSSSVRAQESEPASGDEATTRSAVLATPPLAPLPTPPSRRLGEPKQEDTELLDRLLSRLTSAEDRDHQVGLADLLEADASLLPAVKARIDGEANRANRDAMKRLLIDTRKTARDELERDMRARGERGEVPTPDYLPMMLAHPRPESEHYKRLVRVLALSRLCVQLGSVEAVRVLIHIYVRFDFLRIDTQLQLKKLGDKSLAALIETTHHDAASIANWAKRRLDFLGKAIPSEVVQVEDGQVLADILRAYGRVKDPDSARLVISFANSERTQVREAARQAVAMFGETANWSLRDTYENMVGRKPPREWSWDRTARELFREFDRIRLAELYEYYASGLQAQKDGKLDEMREAFDKVLARSPDFEPRDKIVEGYFDYASSRFEQAPEAAQLALLRVERLAAGETERNRARSLLLTLNAKRLADEKIADRNLLTRAIELDADNAQARELLAELSTEPFVERSSFMRVLWPALVGACAILFATFVAVFWRRRSNAPSQ